MAEQFAELDENHRAFIQEQLLFFTASATASGRINLSPKGMDTFRCLDSRRVAYLDMTGSSNETAAHLRQDGRLTIMFCSFSKKPQIMRLWGKGRGITPRAADWDEYAPHFELLPGFRQIILLMIAGVETSCGYGVPIASELRERPTLRKWGEKKGAAGITAYQRENNLLSFDGLPSGLFE